MEPHMFNKKLYVVITLAAIAGIGGCATSGDLEALREEVNQANSTAESASSSADAANQTAAEAKAIAEDAKVSADEANSKIDNMFKKSMYK